jgi:hypothetical protein
MIQLTHNSVYSHNVTSLLNHYGFESDTQPLEELVESWEQSYPHPWVRLAAIEALYQGRYKAVSVGQILAIWQRRGQVIHHFNHEFERLISRKKPHKLEIPSFGPRKHLASLDRTNINTKLGIPVEDSPNPKLSPQANEDDSQYIADFVHEVESPIFDSQANSVPLSSSLTTEVENIAELSQGSIDRFTPTLDRSDVYSKLIALSTDSKL